MKRRHLRRDAFYAEGASFMNRGEIEQSTLCGCFVCNLLFPSELIKEWTYELKIDENTTTASAICPYCGGDTVIPESESYTLDKELIEYLYKKEKKKFDKWCKKNKILD